MKNLSTCAKYGPTISDIACLVGYLCISHTLFFAKKNIYLSHTCLQEYIRFGFRCKHQIFFIHELVWKWTNIFIIYKIFIVSEIITAVLLLSYTAYARISVMYAHEKISDMVAQQCLTEMYPKGKKIELQESDESCIIYCVLKKFGIINGNGQFNLDIYR